MTQNIPLPIILLPLPWKYLIGRFCRYADSLYNQGYATATQSTKQPINKTTKQQNNIQ